MRENLIIYRMELLEAGKANAAKVGQTEKAILNANGLQATHLGSNGARNWKVYANAHNADENAPYGRVSEEIYMRYCRAFMIDPEAYIVKEMPVKPESAPAASNDVTIKILQCLEGIEKHLGKIEEQLSLNINESKEGFLCVVNELDKTEKIMTESQKVLRAMFTKEEVASRKASDIASDVNVIRQNIVK